MRLGSGVLVVVTPGLPQGNSEVIGLPDGKLRSMVRIPHAFHLLTVVMSITYR